MKKGTIFVIFILCISLLCGCVDGGKKDAQQDILKKIYEIDSAQYGTEDNLHHRNLISDRIQYSVDSSMKSEKIVEIAGINHNLEYKDTLYYPVGQKTLYRYLVDGNEEKEVLIDGDGKIKSILYDYTVLDLSETTNPNDVLEVLKIELAKNFDLSRYTYVEIPEQGYRISHYHFLNVENGYITENLSTAVSQDGRVLGVQVVDLESRDLTLDIDKKKEQQAIELKLKEMYNTDSYKYCSHAMSGKPRVTTYNGQLCIKYSVGARYVNIQSEEQEETSSFLHTILIPIEVISN